jgi:hypothetical protein
MIHFRESISMVYFMEEILTWQAVLLFRIACFFIHPSIYDTKVPNKDTKSVASFLLETSTHTHVRALASFPTYQKIGTDEYTMDRNNHSLQ